MVVLVDQLSIRPRITSRDRYEADGRRSRPSTFPRIVPYLPVFLTLFDARGAATASPVEYRLGSCLSGAHHGVGAAVLRRWEKEKIVRLLLVRHGQSAANAESRIQSDDDPLSELGHLQAMAVGTELQRRGDLTHFYSSPLIRARETATLISQCVGVEPQFEHDLAEINTGRVSGLLWKEWNEQYPEQAALQRRNEYLHQWEGGESGQEFARRVFSVFDIIVARHQEADDVVLVVTHGGPLAWIAARAHGDPLDVWPHPRRVVRNGSISELSIDASGTKTLGPWDQMSHVEAHTQVAFPKTGTVEE